MASDTASIRTRPRYPVANATGQSTRNGRERAKEGDESKRAAYTLAALSMRST